MIGKAYVMTLLGMISVHVMRVSVPFVGQYLMKGLGVDETYMGMMLGFAYLAGTAAYLFHLFVPFKNYTLNYALNIGVGSAALGLSCFFIHSAEWARVVVLVLMMVFGWGTCLSVVLTATILNKHHHAGQQSCAVGFWVSGSDIGNILGFFIATSLLYTLHAPYYFVIVFAALFALVIAILMHFVLDPVKEYTLIEPDCAGHINNIISFVSRFDNCATLLTSMLMVGCQYLFLLWLPLQLAQQNEAYIPICFSGLAIPGTTILGWAYGRLQQNRRWQKGLLVGSLLMVLLMVWLLSSSSLNVEDKYGLMGLVGVFGFFLGSCTNVSCIYAHLLLSHRTTFTASFVLMLSTMSWNLIIAVLQFVVGGTTDYQNESMLHVVFALIIVTILILLLQIIFQKSQNFFSL